ncbi:hypothetical protein FRB94_014153 [Tulasnella sp. JGI-2019a]|nr:hypothetical protein FRB94_014153 [Tulasnella sp. JGI-2019a]KAG9033093.1 hypothetical protein FRB95_000597 [Tulasnella sp. JGI-2019a]
MAQSPSAYAAWSKDDLITRINSLESALLNAPGMTPNTIPKPLHHPRTPTLEEVLPPSSDANTSGKKKTKSKPPKAFDFSSYPRRKIALKFCYSGWEYNGLAFQTEPTPLPMVEAVLLNALEECRLIDPAGGFEGCGWSRCGRTDKGVSAAGQVAALWVRSAVGTGKEKNLEGIHLPPAGESEANVLYDGLPGPSTVESTPSFQPPTRPPSPPIQPELRYVNMLNSVLPRSIRILAWSPVSDTFDARFSCTYRHYKYFFNASIPPYPFVDTPRVASSLLDIDTMRDAASRLVGIRDFRHFAKMDPSKQIDNFSREIHQAIISTCDIAPTPAGSSHAPHSPETQMYVFDLKGNGFLWHQVRHIMGILFLVGSGMEHPSIVDALCNTGMDPSIPMSNSLPIVPTKPTYEMADGLPLVLWECGYRDGDVAWRVDDTISTNPASASNASGVGKASPTASQHIFPSFHHTSQQHLIKHTLLNHFSLAATAHHPLIITPSAAPLGAGTSVQASREKYVKVLERPRGERVAELNEKWKTGAGARKLARRATEKAAKDSATGMTRSPELATG